jgi:hypothetical protein
MRPMQVGGLTGRRAEMGRCLVMQNTLSSMVVLRIVLLDW